MSDAPASLQKASEEIAHVAVQDSDFPGKESVAELRIIHGLLDKLIAANAAQSAALIKAARLQRLQWAMTATTLSSHTLHAPPFSFEFETRGSTLNSAAVIGMVHSMLEVFMKGEADCVLDAFSFKVPRKLSDEHSEAASKAAFHEELIDCIYGLIGEKPVISRRQDGYDGYIIQLPPL